MYTPHSFRHFLIESGQQLRTLDVCSVDDLERLGRWTKGSSMPDTYDNASGVSELMARHKVLVHLRSGRRPVAEGCLPMPTVSSSSSSSVPSQTMVAHTKNRKIHAKHPTKGTSLCGMWSCGTANCPTKFAVFSPVDLSWAKCRPCGLAALG